MRKVITGESVRVQADTSLLCRIDKNGARPEHPFAERLDIASPGLRESPWPSPAGFGFAGLTLSALRWPRYGDAVLSGDEADPVVIEHFPAKLTGFFAGVGQVDEWRRTVVRENLAAFGFPPGRQVRLSDYLQAGRGRIDKQQAFLAPLRLLRLPQLIERAESRTCNA